MPDDATPPPPPVPDPVPPAPAPPPPEPIPPPATTAAAEPSPTTTPLGVSPAYGAGKLSAKDDKLFCTLSHVLALVTGFIAPLIFYVAKKDDSPALEAHSKESLNFQITIAIGYIISIVVSVASCGFLFFAPFLVLIYAVVLIVIATMKANDGALYRYPLTWRLIK